jgi:predicted MFS family arabinose efflux permease
MVASGREAYIRPRLLHLVGGCSSSANIALDNFDFCISPRPLAPPEGQPTGIASNYEFYTLLLSPMVSASTCTHPVSGRAAQLSTRIVFFIAGFGMAAWAPLVPFAKARAGIGEGVLGLLLLCLGIGSIVAMPLAGACAARFGCRLVIAVSTALLCAALPLLATLSSLPLLAAALLTFGAGLGSIDVAMNIQAIIVERASGRAMMSGFHGLFSLGGVAGPAGVSALLGAGGKRSVKLSITHI